MAHDANLYRYVQNQPVLLTDPSGERILSFEGCSQAETNDLTAADVAVAARVPHIIAELKAYGIGTAQEWVTEKKRKATQLAVQNQKFTNYRRKIMIVFDEIQRQITSGYDVCCTDLPTAVASTPDNVLGTLWYGSVIWFDHNSYFGQRASLPVGATTWFTPTQTGTLLHELSHMAAGTGDANWSWLPGAPASLPGNPTNIPFSEQFMPTLAAKDAYFVQVFQEHTAREVNETWILPYLYER